jgi:hypothetical protein
MYFGVTPCRRSRRYIGRVIRVVGVAVERVASVSRSRPLVIDQPATTLDDPGVLHESVGFDQTTALIFIGWSSPLVGNPEQPLHRGWR